MLRYQSGWCWDGTDLRLSSTEDALLCAMLRERPRRKPPYRWLGDALVQPVSPRSGEAWWRLLQRKLIWAGAPADLLRGDPSQTWLAEDLPIGDDPQTLAAIAGHPPDLEQRSG